MVVGGGGGGRKVVVTDVALPLPTVRRVIAARPSPKLPSTVVSGATTSNSDFQPLTGSSAPGDVGASMLIHAVSSSGAKGKSCLSKGWEQSLGGGSRMHCVLWRVSPSFTHPYTARYGGQSILVSSFPPL